jgi:alpha-glucosidase
MTLGTRAHQLALSVVFESPLQEFGSAPPSDADQRDFAFLKTVPVSWDETRAIQGSMGEFIAIARRSGTQWYLGAITNPTARDLNVPLSFLGAGSYTAEIFSDAADANTNPKHTEIEERRVTASDSLLLKLANGGGAAIRFRPLN